MVPYWFNRTPVHQATFPTYFCEPHPLRLDSNSSSYDVDKKQWNDFPSTEQWTVAFLCSFTLQLIFGSYEQENIYRLIPVDLCCLCSHMSSRHVYFICQAVLFVQLWLLHYNNVCTFNYSRVYLQELTYVICNICTNSLSFDSFKPNTFTAQHKL